ncbi:MAG: hypothetical protein JRJ75_10955 [Deltaproteobacteria bacterium]|nr:hypothetical protein [Deltaproteobacteria bacterium]
MEGRRNIRYRESRAQTKVISSRYLTSECWSIQFRGLPHCRECEYLATEMCGGLRTRKSILAAEYPLQGLPDISMKL